MHATVHAMDIVAHHGWQLDRHCCQGQEALCHLIPISASSQDVTCRRTTAHLGLAQHAGSMVPGFFSFLHQRLLSMSFWVELIDQDLRSILQDDPHLQL